MRQALRGIVFVILIYVFFADFQVNETWKSGVWKVGDQYAIVSHQQKQGTIINYAIREDGWVAVMTKLGMNSYANVNIYNRKHEFQTSFRMKPNEIFYADWEENGNLSVWRFDGEVCYELSSEGVILAIEQRKPNDDFETYVNDLKKSKKEVGDKTYVSQLRHRQFRAISPFKDELLCTENGKKTVIYFSNTFEGLKVFIICCAFPVWLCNEVKYILLNFQQRKRIQEEPQPE